MENNIYDIKALRQDFSNIERGSRYRKLIRYHTTDHSSQNVRLYIAKSILQYFASTHILDCVPAPIKSMT
jgi:hypothetical protein